MRCHWSIARCAWSDARCRFSLIDCGQHETLHNGRRGFTLIEMLVVMALLTMLTGVLVLLLKETLQVERLQAKAFDKVLQDSALADQFRADVAQAESAPREWRDFKADRRTLILQMPDGDHVVYLQQEDTLLRRAFENGKESVRTLPLGSNVDVEFKLPGRRQPKSLCFLRLHVHVREGSPLPGQAAGNRRRPGRRLAMRYSRTSTRRQGVALVMALVVMAILAVILTVVTRQIVSQRHTLHHRHRQLQAEWLARAGVELAAARLLEDPTAFAQENHDLLPDAMVRIVVEKAGQDMYTVTVEAELGPKDEALMVRTSRSRFRRAESDGAIRLQALQSEKPY